MNWIPEKKMKKIYRHRKDSTARRFGYRRCCRHTGPKSKRGLEMKRTRVSTGHDVPREVEEQILLRLPVKSLVRFRSVCRAWNSLITDNQFVNNHLQLQAKKTPSSFLLGWARKDPFAVLDKDGQDVDFDKKQMLTLLSVGDSIAVREELYLPIRPALLGDGFGSIMYLDGYHCNGIICLVDDSPLFTLRVVFYNPALREHVYVQTLPCIPDFHGICDSGCGFGHDPRTDDYKFVRLVWYGRLGMLKAEVYSLRTGRWKEIEVNKALRPCGRGAYLNGRLYWKNHNGANVITWFDMFDESFGGIYMPKPRGRSTLLVWKGSLAFFDHWDSFEMWVIDCDAGCLSKYYWIGALPGVLDAIAFWKDDELLMVGHDGSPMSYNLGTKELRKVLIPISTVRNSIYGSLYAETLVSVKTRALVNL